MFAASTTDSTSMPLLAGVGDHVVGRVDEDGEVVEQRPLGRAGVARAELDERAADLDPADASRTEAVLLVRLGRRRRVGRAQRDVVEVVLDIGRRLDERQADPVADVEDLRRSLGQRGAGSRKIGDAKRHVLEGAGVARRLGVEERQLARGERRCPAA